MNISFRHTYIVYERLITCKLTIHLDKENCSFRTKYTIGKKKIDSLIVLVVFNLLNDMGDFNHKMRKISHITYVACIYFLSKGITVEMTRKRLYTSFHRRKRKLLQLEKWYLQETSKLCQTHKNYIQLPYQTMPYLHLPKSARNTS